ncbi:hypothetical protein [Neobacillus mesonae]|uniref:hypothetical protein n=1 Tax=Neobacillus mesonae TaxID=1193713 RepID=UPI00082E0E27|nr:hypothetical protein [Neobacillus mesonae]
MNWKIINNRNDQIKLLISALKLPNFPNELMKQEAVISEYLRDCIHKLTHIEQDDNFLRDNNPVHTRKVMYILRQQLEAVWPAKKSWQLSKFDNDNSKRFDNPLETELIRSKLVTLELLGDISHIGNGFWIPTPIRLIQLPNNEDIALIGGSSTKYASIISGSISQVGLGRVIKKDNISKWALDDKKLWQPYSQWAGWIPKNLSEWTKAQIKQAQEKGASTLYSYDDFEIFISFKSNSNFRTAWIKAIEASDDIPKRGVLLCRTRDKRLSYFLGVFKDGKIIKELPIKDKEILSWLRIGLRNIHGRNLAGRWTEGKLRVYPPLPKPLERIILLHSYKIKTPEETAYYALDEYKGKVEENLKNFGYVFIKK